MFSSFKKINKITQFEKKISEITQFYMSRFKNVTFQRNYKMSCINYNEKR